MTEIPEEQVAASIRVVMLRDGRVTVSVDGEPPLLVVLGMLSVAQASVQARLTKPTGEQQASRLVVPNLVMPS